MADFFAPGTTYMRDDPYKAPELLEVFHCVAVANSPRNGELRAFGFAKGLTESVEGWYSTALTPEVWAVGWIESTEVLFTRDAEAETADEVTEAFVDVADAERYAQRDEYVNAAGDLIGAMARHSSTHGTTAVYDAADPHDAALARQARTEYVDYAEAEDVREIEREMAIEAGDDSELDRQVAEDDARFERAVWLLQQEAESEAAQEAWIGQRETAVDEALDARDTESEA